MQEDKLVAIDRTLPYDEEVNKLIEWLQHMPHLPNITGKSILDLN